MGDELIPACKTCGNPLDRTAKLVPGHVVVRCIQCRAYWLEGDEHFRVESGYNAAHALQERANNLDAIKREQEVMTSDIEDPRWVRIDNDPR